MNHRGRWATGAWALAACGLWVAVLPSEVRADWPTYRGDPQRSGVAAQSLGLPLEEVWVHQPAAPPAPAWPELPARQDVWHRLPWLSPTVTYDRAFHVAAAGDRIFFGSSSEDTVTCLHAASGKVRWSYATEGPVRLAPTVAGGRVYAGSDDGCLYCLDAADGKLLWRYRAGPEDRRLPGNGRMISLCPIRCGIVADGGTVYVCAGLFPSQGAYLAALDAQNGRPLWKQPIHVSPQGYLLASASRLYVPTGRAAPHVYSRADGKDLGAVPGGGVDRRAGGSFALLAGGMLVHAAGEDGKLQFSKADTPEKIVSAAGLRLLVAGPTSYILTRDRLCAVDRAAYLELGRLRAMKKRTPQQQQRLEELGSDPRGCVKWDVACVNPYELILAGDTIFAGGEDRVVAYRAADGKQAWTGPVTGKAYGLAVSGGRLLVSTDTGAIYCFAKKGTAPVPRSAAEDGVGCVERTSSAGSAVDNRFRCVSRTLLASPYPEDRRGSLLRQAAEKVLQAAGVNQGYCLVLGAGDGRLVYEIAKRSQLQVIGLEADAAKAATARKLLSQAGLYGTRASLHCGTLRQVRYQPYFANLVTSAEAALDGKLPAAAEVARVLRPCGGRAVLVLPPGIGENVSGARVHHARHVGNVPHGVPQTLDKWGSGTLPGWKVERDRDGFWLGTARRGRLPGAGQWNHLYADAGNSACSGDQAAQGPVSIQWFGRPGPRRLVDRHDKNTSPVYACGRLFVSGNNYIVAVDAYNGTILWDRDVPDSVRLGALKNCGNMAATDDLLYVAAANECLALDAGTGRQKFAVPIRTSGPGGRKEWGYVAAVGDLLLGSETKARAAFRYQTIDTEVLIWRDRMPVVSSDTLFALDRHAGKRLWDYTPAAGVIVNPTIAAGGGRVYFVESTNPDTREVADSRIKLDVLLGKGSNLVALDLPSGKVLWSRPASLEQLEHIIFLSYAKGVLVITGSKNVVVDGKGRVRYDLAAFEAASGKPLWKNTQTPIPDHLLQGPHGEQVQHSAIVGEVIYNTGFACNLRTGEPVPGWKWQKSGYCGTLSTSASCAFSRYSNGRMFDLATGRHTDLTNTVRSGCWINIIPAGGLVMIPEASSGCICGYPIQTSIALLPLSSGQ
jgi:outer membrane protein assembly factor BamB